MTDFKVGDKVRLTGPGWCSGENPNPITGERIPMHGDVITIAEATAWGTYVFHVEGEAYGWYVWPEPDQFGGELVPDPSQVGTVNYQRGYLDGLMGMLDEPSLGDDYDRGHLAGGQMRSLLPEEARP